MYGAVVSDVAVKVTNGAVEFWQIAVVPLIDAAGKGFTVTWYSAGAGAMQPKVLVKLTLTYCGPVTSHLTVTVFSVELPPKMRVPPGEIVHIYALIPAWVV